MNEYDRLVDRVAHALRATGDIESLVAGDQSGEESEEHCLDHRDDQLAQSGQ